MRRRGRRSHSTHRSSLAHPGVPAPHRGQALATHVTANELQFSSTDGMANASTPPPLTRLAGTLFAAPFLLMGALIVGIGCNWIPHDPASVHAPRWVLVTCGMVFIWRANSATPGMPNVVPVLPTASTNSS